MHIRLFYSRRKYFEDVYVHRMDVRMLKLGIFLYKNSPLVNLMFLERLIIFRKIFESLNHESVNLSPRDTRL